MLTYILGITERANKGITNRGRFKVFQIGAKRLQIGPGISIRSKEISNRVRDHKSRHELRIGAKQKVLF